MEYRINDDQQNEVKGEKAIRQLVVIESLNPAQQVVIQKLLKSVVGACDTSGTGDWELGGVRVSLTDAGLEIAGLNFEQSGMPRDGRGRSLMEVSHDEGLRPSFNSYRLTVEIDLNGLGDMSGGDFKLLFGEDLARTLTFAVVAEEDFDAGAGLIAGEVDGAVDGVLDGKR